MSRINPIGYEGYLDSFPEELGPCDTCKGHVPCEECEHGEEDSMSKIKALEKDVKTLVFRLMGESEDSFSPETLEVMRRWRKKLSDHFVD